VSPRDLGISSCVRSAPAGRRREPRSALVGPGSHFEGLNSARRVTLHGGVAGELRGRPQRPAICAVRQLSCPRPLEPAPAGTASGEQSHPDAKLPPTRHKNPDDPEAQQDHEGFRLVSQSQGRKQKSDYRPLTVEVTRSIRSQAPVQRDTACHGNGTRRCYQQLPVTPAVRSL
jgi:hypothetical protein